MNPKPIAQIFVKIFGFFIEIGKILLRLLILCFRLVFAVVIAITRFIYDMYWVATGKALNAEFIDSAINWYIYHSIRFEDKVGLSAPEPEPELCSCEFCTQLRGLHSDPSTP